MTRRPLSVLIADDAEEIRTILRSFLQEEGFRVVGEARDGPEAVELAASLQPDAVVLDLAMPRMDGLEAAALIRRRAPRTRIVVLSGFDERAFASRALAAGADLYLEKGRGLGELAFAISTICALPFSDSDERTMTPTGPDGQVLDMLGRELRTPVSVVEYLLARLRENAESLTPDALRQGLDAIGHNVRTLGSLIRSFADAASIEGAGVQVQPELIDAGAVTRRTVEDLRPALDPHPVSVEVSGELWVRADPERIAQILGNVVSNAAKFSGSNAPIEVTAEAGETDVEVSVRDHGPGIPEDRLEEAFGRFGRLNTSVKGLGLGLYVARGLARAQGGELTAEAAPGGGTRVRLRLPAADRRPARAALDDLR